MRKPKLRISSGYLTPVYDVKRLPNIIDKMEGLIKKLQKRKRVDAIAFTGTSGAAVAYPLSVKMGIPLICIRKAADASHYSRLYEGVTGVQQYIIVDDCIDSGDTVRRIKKEVKNHCPKAKPIGIFLYNHDYWRTRHGSVPVYSERM